MVLTRFHLWTLFEQLRSSPQDWVLLAFSAVRSHWMQPLHKLDVATLREKHGLLLVGDGLGGEAVKNGLRGRQARVDAVFELYAFRLHGLVWDIHEVDREFGVFNSIAGGHYFPGAVGDRPALCAGENERRRIASRPVIVNVPPAGLIPANGNGGENELGKWLPYVTRKRKVHPELDVESRLGVCEQCIVYCKDTDGDRWHEIGSWIGGRKIHAFSFSAG